LKAFCLELKSTCLSYRFLFFILIILFLQFTFIQQSQSEQQTQQAYRHIYHKNTLILLETRIYYYEEAWESGKLELAEDEYENFLSYLRYLLTVAEEQCQYYFEQHWDAYNLQTVKFHLLLWETEANQYSSAPTPQQYFGEEWQQVRSQVEYPHFNPHAMAEKDDQSAEAGILSADLHWRLYQQGLQPLGPYYPSSPWSFVFNFARNVMPSVLGAIALIFTVNLLYQERKTGAQKTALQFLGRTRYLSRKVAKGFLAVALIMLLPLILSVSFLGIKHGFHGLNHPVLLDNGFLSFSVNSAQVSMYNSELPSLGLSQYAHSYTSFSNLERLDFIPLWKFLFLAQLLTLLFILFCTVLGTLISLTIKNGVLAHVLTAIIATIGTVFDRIFPNLKTTPWDLFSAANPIPLLEGSHYSTYLSSLLCISVVAALLFLLSSVVFKRQDVNC